MEKEFNLKELFEKVSPIIITPKTTSIHLEISKRFLLFELLKQVTEKIEDEPYLNFISALKYYKILGHFLHGTIKELHRDRKKNYFKDFFMSESLYNLVVRDIEWAYSINKNLNITITKKGIVTYDNYKKDAFNIFLITVHSGTWMPENIQKKQLVGAETRRLEEDIDVHRLYGRLVLEKSGIWMDNKLSRFAIDYNREKEKAIYDNYSEEWLEKLWKEPLSKSQKNWLLAGYNEFYFTLGNLVDTYKFNIIFDAHTMKNADGRPDMSFGTEYVPVFYMPIVKSIKDRLEKLGYNSVAMNAPFKGGNILKYLSKRFPHVFILSMEVNKRLYMSDDRKIVNEEKIEEISKAVVNMFDI
jgi:N-formylglutamate amidohydrolase